MQARRDFLKLATTLSGQRKRQGGQRQKREDVAWFDCDSFYLSSACYVHGAGYTHATCGIIFPVNLDEQAFLRRLASNLFA
jgi:hypothetical protein